MTRSKKPNDPFGAIQALSPAAVRERQSGRATARRLLKGDADGWPGVQPMPTPTSRALIAATDRAAEDLADDAQRRMNRGRS